MADDNKPEEGAPTPPQGGQTISPGQEAGETTADTASASTASAGAQSASSGQIHKKRKTGLITAIVVAALVVFGLGGYAAYAQFVTPQQALSNYFERLADAESAQYELTVSSSTEDEFGESEFSFVSTGSLSGTDEDDFRFDSSNSIDTETTVQDFAAEAFGLNLDIRYVDETVYLRTDDADGIASEFAPVEAGTWYSFDIEDRDELDEFGADVCSEEDIEAMTNYFENGVTDRIEIEDAERHTWLPMDRNGHRVQHYSGVLSAEIVVDIQSDLADITSDDCMSEEDVDALEDDMADIDLAYDLYTGSDYDELVLEISNGDGESVDLTLTTENYNEPVDIEAPEDAVSFEELMEEMFQDFLGPMDGGQDFDFEGDIDFDGEFEFDDDFDTMSPEDFEVY